MKNRNCVFACMLAFVFIGANENHKGYLYPTIPDIPFCFTHTGIPWSCTHKIHCLLKILFATEINFISTSACYKIMHLKSYLLVHGVWSRRKKLLFDVLNDAAKTGLAASEPLFIQTHFNGHFLLPSVLRGMGQRLTVQACINFLLPSVLRGMGQRLTVQACINFLLPSVLRGMGEGQFALCGDCELRQVVVDAGGTLGYGGHGSMCLVGSGTLGYVMLPKKSGDYFVEVTMP